MAKTIPDEIVAVNPWLEWGRIVGIGALVGLGFWTVTILMSRYVVEPIACRQLTDAALCLGATPLAGNITAILAAFAGLLVLVRMRTALPVVIAIGSAALLWDLGGWVEGLFWLEAILWCVLLYAASYGLFAWITRATRLWVIFALAIAVVLAIRILLVF